MKHKKPMVIALSIAGILILVLVMGRVSLSFRFGKQVKELFSLSTNIPAKTFTNRQLTGLPEPVQRYFRHVLKEGQPYINYVRMTHDGQFKPGLDKDWVAI